MLFKELVTFYSANEVSRQLKKEDGTYSIFYFRYLPRIDGALKSV
jgi:hypothetical protein